MINIIGYYGLFKRIKVQYEIMATEKMARVNKA